MEQTDYGSFTEYFEENGRTVYFAIHPEYSPAGDSIAPTGKYFVYCIDPIHGNCHFTIERNERDRWISNDLPVFIKPETADWIGERVEVRNK